MKREYKWAPGYPSRGVDPEIAGKEIEKLGEEVTASMVVEAAKKKTSPIHNLFEWDQSKAAAKYNEQQARELLNHLVFTVEIEKQDQQVRSFHMVETTTDRAYVSLSAVEENPDYISQIVAQAKAELASFARKYRCYKALEKIVKAVETLST